MTMHDDPIDIAFRLGLGPWLTPLRGKKPVFDAWPDLDPVDEAQVREWQDEGHAGFGLRCGARSGVFIVDVDITKGATWRPPAQYQPDVQTPGGGLHYYFRAPDPCPGNTASKIAPHVDTRGEGGQAAFPGSRHPDTGGIYRFLRVPTLPELPSEILDLLRDPERPERPERKPTPPAQPSPALSTRYAMTALHREVHAVRTAADGMRNDTLNRAAFNLGQLVGGGALSEGEVVEQLTAAAKIAGLQDRETNATIRSGLTAGIKEPRTAPVSTATAAPPDLVPPPIVKPKRRKVFVPGSHQTEKEYIEQTSDDFTREVLAALPPEALYRRAGRVGEILGGRFQAVSPDRIRGIVDRHVRLQAGKEDRKTGEIAIVYRPCSKDNAGLLQAWGEVASDGIRDLQFLAEHPICVGPQFEVAPPGWHAESGTYRSDDIKPEPLPLDTARAVLEDLVCDFPFQSKADRANYIGLLLTPILRPALNEPVPMHLIGASLERSGKTKLAEIVLGCSVLGRPTPAMQLGVREEEREKRITAVLLSGASVLHLDNLGAFLDSAALASLLTSSTYQGRELNHSRMLDLSNGLTIVGTGNNVHATGEVSKRIVPITLQPSTENPETREDFRHPLLRQYVETSRERVLGALLGMIEAWRAAGRPLGSVGFGGFERWAAVMGGIMKVAGYEEWLSNLAEWRGGADDFSDELREFVRAWHERYACEAVAARSLFDLAGECELFERQTSQATEQGRRTAFGQRVLSVAANRVVGEFRIEVKGRGDRRRARLMRVE